MKISPLFLFSLLLLTTTTACGSKDTDTAATDTDADTDTDTDTDADSDSDSDTDLTSGHPGWQQADCLPCHSYDSHNQDKMPWECAECHGTNGAPLGEGMSSPCLPCHGPTAGSPAPHTTTDWPDPSACLVCHPG